MSGFSPIKAQKVRYYADKNFTGRVVTPPLSPDGHGGLSPNTPDVWGSTTRLVDDRLYTKAEKEAVANNAVKDEGGKDHKPEINVSELMADTPENLSLIHI